MALKKCLNCNYAVGDFCMEFRRHIADVEKDREDCVKWTKIGNGSGNSKFSTGEWKCLYESDDEKLADEVRRKPL